MMYGKGVTLALMLAAAPPAATATKDQEIPDKEMLRMMELLKEMEMIKQLEMMRELHRVDPMGDQVKNAKPAKSLPAKKETLK